MFIQNTAQLLCSQLKESLTHHVAVRDQPAHDLLAPQLSTADVLFHFLAEGGHHLVVEAVHLGEGQVARESGATGQLLDTSPHLQPSIVIFTYKYMYIHYYCIYMYMRIQTLDSHKPQTSHFERK